MVSIGSSGSRSAFSEDSTQAHGNRVQAGGLTKFQATGEKDQGQGNMIIRGSQIDAKNVHLAATDRVDLLNSTDTERVRHDNGSTSGSVGVSIGTKGLGVSASAARANGDGNSDGAMQNNTHVRARESVTIKSGGDTNVVGANVKGNRVVADVQGDLNVGSVQDTSVSAAHQHSTGVGLNVSQGGGSASFNVQNGNARGNYASVTEQSGIEVGEGGFDIAVKGNTDLKGAYISSEAAKDQNRLKTGMLSYSAIENHSDYQASTLGISGGATTGDGGNVYQPTGSSSGKNAGGASPLYLSESGSSRARTQSAISAAEIEITNPDQQKQAIAGLNRDATNLSGRVDKTPDVQQSLQNQGELMSAMRDAGEAVARRIGDVADAKRDALLQAASESDDPQQKQQYLAEAEQWGESGHYRVGLQSAGGSLVGGIGGGLLGAAQSGAGSLVSALLAHKLDAVSQQIADQKPTGNADLDKTLGNIVANVMSSVAGGVVGGTQGAQAAYNVDRFNRQLHQGEYDLAKRHAKLVAQQLKISEQEAEGRIVAEILRNSDQQTAEATGSKHDYEIRSIVGCQNLNCYGDKKDAQYADHDYNSQYIKPNQEAYDAGQSQLGRGQTYNELVTSNINKDPVGATVAGAGMMGLGLAAGGSLAPAGMMGAGALLGLGANGGVQLMGDQPFDWTSFALSGVTSAVSTGMKFVPVFMTGVGGALTGSALQGQNPNAAMGGAAVGTVIGYPIGAKIEGKLNDVLNPWYRQE
ncbi:hemagglutinin repeat-containing protein [Mycetohabitans rhizoxinica]|uniref:hemagglutinin repeat-containing protein n=1 Tax=Mycetohabitans rhizoxinica TaxID=412963 RepID=UPI0030CDA595